MNQAAYAIALWCGLPALGADFEKEVAPILAARCLECHNATEAAGGLRLVSEAGLRKGGDEGAVLDPAAAHGGRLLERIKAGEMPPESKGKSQKLPAAEIATLEAWIKSGAPWPKGRVIDPYERTSPARGGRDWWSLQPVKRTEPPALKSGVKKANPIDAFLETEREKAGLVAAPAADRRTLLRRVYYTLHGLPPTAAELDAFAADDRPDAYERAVDKLLASPRYGERWGRHWLDVARYAETSGYERDQEKPGAWKYRDWVIAAFNADMPFDRFVREQLAGDEIPGRTEASTIATGFLRLGTWNDEPNDPGEYVYERLDDLVHATSAAFLGLTVRCARCHDHKFDPIPQTDYYRLATAFWAGPMTERKREWVGGPSKEELGFDVLGWTDVRMPPPPLHLLKKGDARHPAEPIAPATLSILPKLEKPMAPPAAGAKTAGRRRQLADWLCDPANPLPARVYVNRLWIHHFGKGLVPSPNNFGFKGDSPTNPA
ncbi:MAG TPA: DUF1549 domain-containing protein, partial [Planctomycetia bacterium]|nr:DUF1549 domain-containing protein [Planctomycetia bacterium]